MDSRTSRSLPGLTAAISLVIAMAFLLVWALQDRKAGAAAAPSAAAVPSTASGTRTSNPERAANDLAEEGSTIAESGEAGSPPAVLQGHQMGGASPASSNDGEIRIVKYSDLSEADKRWIKDRSARQGYYGFDDISSYLAYDAQTMLELARNGDGPAAFLVVGDMTTYPEEIRREIAISSAKLGRTQGLYVFGIEPFDFIDMDPSDPRTPVGWSPPTDERLVEGYGMMLAALQLGDDLANHGTGRSFRIAVERLTPEQIREAEEYATQIIETVQQQLVD